MYSKPKRTKKPHAEEALAWSRCLALVALNQVLAAAGFVRIERSCFRIDDDQLVEYGWTGNLSTPYAYGSCGLLDPLQFVHGSTKRSKLIQEFSCMMSYLGKMCENERPRVQMSMAIQNRSSTHLIVSGVPAACALGFEQAIVFMVFTT